MSEYVRTTRECAVKQLQPELLRAIGSYFQEHSLGYLEAEVLLCCETVSRRKSTPKMASWLKDNADTIIYTGMALTSERLIWVHHGDRSGTLLNAAELKQIRAEFYSSAITKDAGLQIAGYIGDAKVYMRGYIGMGPEPAARKFCEAVQQAIARVKPPARKGLFRWLTG